MVQWSQVVSQEQLDDARTGYANRRIATKNFGYLAMHEGDLKPADADTVGECYGIDTAGRHWWTPEMSRTAFDALEQDAVGVSDDTDEGTPPTEAPVNVDVPHVSQDGDILTCTMGNWEGEPTSYAYEWTVGGSIVEGMTSEHLTVTAAGEGRMASCVVTATNEIGETVAPPSNVIAIGPVG